MPAIRNSLVAGFLFALAAGPATSRADTEIPNLYRDSYALESAGKVKAAANKVLTVLRREPDSYFANLRVGWLFYLQGESEQSVKYYDRAVGLKPKAVEPLLGKLLPLVGIAAWGRVAKTARQVLKLDPGNYTANSKLAYALYMSGNYVRALPVYELLVERYPSVVDMKAGLAWCRLKMGRVAEARTLFLEVLKVNSSHSSAASGLAVCAGPASNP